MPDVAVVGYGPTGATLANQLGRAGVPTVVYERSTDPFPLPRACHLDAEIARVLQGLGFGDALRSLLTESAGMEYVGPSGERLFTFEGFEREPILGWHEDYVFIQPELDSMLRRGVEQYPCVEVRLGEAAPPLDELDIGYVVACDGASSAVRRSLGIGLVDHGFDEDWLVVDLMLRRDVALPSIIQQVADPARLATFVPSHGPHRRWELRVLPGEDPAALAAPARVWELLSPWGVGPDDADLVRAATYRFHAVVAERWRDGRVFLAGDAAHQTPPFMGQGLCSGVRDAANLAWKLAAVLRGEAGDDLLDTYEAERRPHTEAVIRLSVQAGRLLGELARAVADGEPLVLPEPDAPDPRRWSRLPGLDLGGPFPIGHLVPQPVVDGRPLDELLGDGWAVVAAAPLDDDEVAALRAPPGTPVVVAPSATYGERSVLVRPDRYINAVLGPTPHAAGRSWLADVNRGEQRGVTCGWERASGR